MTVTAQWLPVADREAVVDVERMVRDGRAFRVRAGGDAIGTSVSASARGGVVGSHEGVAEEGSRHLAACKRDKPCSGSAA
jgi:hypothetical protein